MTPSFTAQQRSPEQHRRSCPTYRRTLSCRGISRPCTPLLEPDTLSTENTDEAVNDFDDRLKRAQGKARIVEMMLAENDSSKDAPAAGTAGDAVLDGAKPAGHALAAPAARTEW